MGDRRGYSWPPFERDNLAAVKSGADSPRLLSPLADELLASLEQAAPWTSLPVFAAMRERWAWSEAACILRRRWIDEHGLTAEDGTDLPGVEAWQRLEGRAAKAAAELGLTPLALTRLLSGLSSIDAPAAQAGLDALRAAGAAIAEAATQRSIGATS